MADAPLQQQSTKAEAAPAQSGEKPIAEKQMPASQETFFESLRTLIDTNKWPCWLSLLLAAFVGLPQWQGYLSFYFDALHHVGGIPDVMANCLPYVAIGLAAFGMIYMGCAIYQEEAERARPWIPLAGWTILICALISIGTFVLFAVFITHSNIPAAMQYFSEKTANRRIYGKEEATLKEEFTKIKDSVPPFSIEAEREIESLQYARDLLRVSKEGGLKLVLDGREQNSVVPRDLDSTSWSGIMIAVQFEDAPIRPAILLKAAFDAAGLKSQYITVSNGAPDTLFIIVAPK
ncbi:MAG: hypothetical protein ACRYG6_13635 [Janthinobacterium lividum]